MSGFSARESESKTPQSQGESLWPLRASLPATRGLARRLVLYNACIFKSPTIAKLQGSPSTARGLARRLTIHFALLNYAIARVIAGQIQVIGLETCLIHSWTRVISFAIPPVKAEPIVLAVHGVFVI